MSDPKLDVFWQFMTVVDWQDKVATEGDEQAMYDRAMTVLTTYNRSSQFALFEAWERAVATLLLRLDEALTGIAGIEGSSKKFLPVVEHVVSLGQWRYNEAMSAASVAPWLDSRKQSRTFKEALITTLSTPASQEESDFWEFIRLLQRAERHFGDWEEEAPAHLQSYEPAKQQQFKETFFALHEDLMRRCHQPEWSGQLSPFTPDRLHSVTAFAVFQGQTFYYQVWVEPTKLNSFATIEVGKRDRMWRYAQTPINHSAIQEAPEPLLLPVTLLAPAVLEALGYAFAEGQSVADLAVGHGVEPAVIEALLRLVLTLKK